MIFLKKYLPDIIVLVGVYLTSYSLLRPPTKLGLGIDIVGPYYDYHVGSKIFGIMMIAVGLDIAIRRYLDYKIISYFTGI